MTAVAMSERAERVYDAVVRAIRATGLPPTMRELGEACGISSTFVVSYQLKKLERMGLIERREGVSRGIALRTGAGMGNGFRQAATPPAGEGAPVCRAELDTRVIGRAWLHLEIPGTAPIARSVTREQLVDIRDAAATAVAAFDAAAGFREGKAG